MNPSSNFPLRDFFRDIPNSPKFPTSLRRFESSRKIYPELLLAKKMIVENETKYNEIHSLIIVKTKQLAELTAILAQIRPRIGNVSGNNGLAVKVRKELSGTIEGLKTEQFTRETLEIMVDSRNIAVKKQEKLINAVKQRINVVNFDIESAHSETESVEKSLKLLNREYEIALKELQSRKSYHFAQISKERTEIKTKEKLLLFLKKQHQSSIEMHKRSEIAKAIANMQQKVDLLHESEKANDEISKLEIESEQLEGKLKQIKQHVEISSGSDIIPYWQYLTETRFALENSIEIYQRSIHELFTKKIKAKKQLQAVLFQTEETHSYISPSDIVSVKSSLRLKCCDLSQSENQLRHLWELIAKATNTVSLIVFMIFMGEGRIVVMPSSAKDCLEMCANQLEAMIQNREKSILRTPKFSLNIHENALHPIETKV